jgi:hypothetical protein
LARIIDNDSFAVGKDLKDPSIVKSVVAVGHRFGRLEAPRRVAMPGQPELCWRPRRAES